MSVSFIVSLKLARLPLAAIISVKRELAILGRLRTWMQVTREASPNVSNEWRKKKNTTFESVQSARLLCTGPSSEWPAAQVGVWALLYGQFVAHYAGTTHSCSQIWPRAHVRERPSSSSPREKHLLNGETFRTLIIINCHLTARSSSGQGLRNWSEAQLPEGQRKTLETTTKTNVELW